MTGSGIADQLIREGLLTLSKAARRIPPMRLDRPVCPQTLSRWARRGIRGNRLETVRIGSKLFTSQAALARFIDRISEHNHEPGARPDPDAAALAAERKCAELLK